MAGIVQHTSAVVAPGARTISVQFGDPVTVGNLLVAVMVAVPQGRIAFTISDAYTVGGDSNTYNSAIDTDLDPDDTAAQIKVSYAIAKESGGLLVVATLANVEQAMHLHIYEITGGYTTLDQVGQNYQPGTANASVSTTGALNSADEIVLAVFANQSGTVSWSLSDSLGEETSNEVDTVASGGKQVSNAQGFVQTASATASASDNMSSAIVTFYNPQPNPTSDQSGSWPTYDHVRRGSAVRTQAAPKATFAGKIPGLRPSSGRRLF